MGSYVDVDSVRRTCGITSETTISDADIGDIIAECEPQIEKFYNTVFTPKEIIETRDGDGTNRMILRRNPVMRVSDLYIDGTQEDTANLSVYKGSGKIVLTTDATSSIFKFGTKKIVIKYTYGWLEDSSTSTTTNAASEDGSSVALSVASESGFSEDDWVEVSGMDGNVETAQISSTGTGELTVDNLYYDHVSGSNVILLEVNQVFKKLMNYACAISIVARIVGQSYTDIVGYGMGEFNVQKGEPYTQWRETALQLTRERDRIMERIKPRPAVM